MATPAVPSPVREELEPGERILWEGQSDPSERFSPTDYYLIPFSLLWLVVVVLAASTQPTSQQPSVFFLALPVFLSVGIYFAFGRFWMKGRRKRRTFYAVTNQRALIVERRGNRTRLQSVFLATLQGINLREGRKGLGTITFGNVSIHANLLGNTGLENLYPYRMYPLPLAFYDVPDARKVYDLVVRARADATRQ